MMTLEQQKEARSKIADILNQAKAKFDEAAKIADQYDINFYLENYVPRTGKYGYTATYYVGKNVNGSWRSSTEDCN